MTRVHVHILVPLVTSEAFIPAFVMGEAKNSSSDVGAKQRHVFLEGNFSPTYDDYTVREMKVWS